MNIEFWIKFFVQSGHKLRLNSTRTGSKGPLSINPEPPTRAQAEGQSPGLRVGKVEGLIFAYPCKIKRVPW